MRLFFVILFLSMTFLGLTQVVSKQVDKYVIENRIDTFLVYSYPCNGYIPIDSCGYEESSFLIWQQKGNYYLKKFDYCSHFNKIPIAPFNSLSYYLSNKTDIDNEEIRQPAYYEVRMRKNKIDTLQYSSMVSHSCSHKFQLPFSEKGKCKYADTYDIDFKDFNNGKQNVNYTYNQNTKFKKMIDMTTSLIERFETGNKFQKD